MQEQYWNIKIGNRCFENVAKFIYLGNLSHEEIRSLLNLKNACYYSVQKILSFLLLSKNIKE
jgi:hypothetical protein